MNERDALTVINRASRPRSGGRYGYRSPAAYQSTAIETAQTLPGLLRQVATCFLGRHLVSADIWTRDPERRGENAMVIRTGPRRMLVIGEHFLADDARSTLAAGDVPGWDLHVLPDRQRPLHALQDTLRVQDYRTLERSGFVTVDEVIATPDQALLDQYHIGPKVLARLRAAIELLPTPDQADHRQPATE